MARGERGKSGQRAPRPCSLRLGERSEEGRAPRKAPTALPAPPQSPRAARASSSSSRLAAGRGQGPVVIAPRRTSPSPQHPPPRFPLSPAHSRLLKPHRRRRKRAHLDRSRGEAGAGARVAASLAAAAGRRVAEKAPFNGTARACSPAAP